jgi:DNA-binding NtrC family response regulator
LKEEAAMLSFEAMLTDQILPHVPILVIDDDRALLPIFDWLIHAVSPGLHYHWCASVEEAREHIERNRYRLILSDFLLEGTGNGLDLWELNRASEAPAEFAMMSSLKLSDFCRSETGPRLLAKPLDVGEVQALIRKACR